MAIYLLIFITSIGLTFLVRHLALKKNIIDNPNERSSHTVPTPRGGGLAIVVMWFVGLVWMYFKEQVPKDLFFALLSGGVLAIVSFLDDILDLSPKVRMPAQAISAALALYFLGGFDFVSTENQALHMIFAFVGLIGIVWFINLYNFLDGIDAYASQEAILVAAGLLILTGNVLLGLLIASVAGFLVWNWPKAKIFMGDVGSTQLGFGLVVLGIYFHNQQDVSIFTWLILTGLFWFDATFTLFRRWRNKEQLSKAHRKHAYQRLTRAGWSHFKVDIWAISINILLVGLAFLSEKYLGYDYLFLIIVVGLLFLINSRVDRIYPFPKD